jgi:hypothetical protein
MSIGMILLIIVILMLAGVVPAWPHSRSWGYAPSGALGLVLLVLLVLLLMGRI